MPAERPVSVISSVMSAVCEPASCSADFAFYTADDINAPAIEPNDSTQVWGDVEPYTGGNPPLCKWVDNACKTDISWLHSAISVKKSFFQDELVNYILRFHLPAACYRSTQARLSAPACCPCRCTDRPPGRCTGPDDTSCNCSSAMYTAAVRVGQLHWH
jgi:hypothetical protein